MNVNGEGVDQCSATIVKDIVALSKDLDVRFVFDPKNANKATYYVAKLIVRHVCPLDWVSSFPPPLSSIFSTNGSALGSSD